MNERPVDATFPQPEAEVLLAKPEAEVEIFQQPETEAFPQIHPSSSVVLARD